jgi:predicted enzyme related to lactoylglutathione lyase
VEIRSVEVAYVHTANPGPLAAWFRETLGLDVAYDDGHWIEFAIGDGTRFGLDGTTFQRSSVEAQPVMISFRVDDVAAAVAELVDRGVTFYPDPERAIFDVGPALVASFQDPEGTWYQLSQPRDG